MKHLSIHEFRKIAHGEKLDPEKEQHFQACERCQSAFTGFKATVEFNERIAKINLRFSDPE